MFCHLDKQWLYRWSILLVVCHDVLSSDHLRARLRLRGLFIWRNELSLLDGVALGFLLIRQILVLIFGLGPGGWPSCLGWHILLGSPGTLVLDRYRAKAVLVLGRIRVVLMGLDRTFSLFIRPVDVPDLFIAQTDICIVWEIIFFVIGVIFLPFLFDFEFSLDWGPFIFVDWAESS